MRAACRGRDDKGVKREPLVKTEALFLITELAIRLNLLYFGIVVSVD
jgi:hypothetical protein